MFGGRPRLKPAKEGQADREAIRRFNNANAHGKLDEVARIFDPNPQ